MIARTDMPAPQRAVARTIFLATYAAAIDAQALSAGLADAEGIVPAGRARLANAVRELQRAWAELSPHARRDLAQTPAIGGAPC